MGRRISETVETALKFNDLTDRIIGVFYEVYNELGHGYLESVYEKSLVLALQEAGLSAQQQVAIPVMFRGHVVGNFAADILVENLVILELKAVRSFDDMHKAQLLNYLRATDIEVGLLLNFGQKPEIKRILLDNDRKKSLVPQSVPLKSILHSE